MHAHTNTHTHTHTLSLSLSLTLATPPQEVKESYVEMKRRLREQKKEAQMLFDDKNNLQYITRKVAEEINESRQLLANAQQTVRKCVRLCVIV